MLEPVAARAGEAPNRVVAATASLIAQRGVRGATLREVAAGAGLPLSTLFQEHGGKQSLVHSGFLLGVGADEAAFRTVLETADRLDADRAQRGHLLWMLCEPAGSDGRERLQLLTELLLQAPKTPQLQRVAREWLWNRRDAVRALLGGDPGAAAASDALMLMHLAETTVAPACCDSLEWRLVGREGFLEAGACLGAWDSHGNAQAIAQSAARFHADPEPPRPTVPDPAPLRRQMVEAAAAIIVESGIAAVTNRAVAARAGCSLAATTYHFRTISDLVLDAVLHIFARSRGVAGGGRLGTGPGGVADWISGRTAPSASERAGTTAFVEIALAASRGQLPGAMGLAIRRQRGTITHARLMARGVAIGRDRTVAAANWFTGVYLVSAALADADALFDFAAQAALVGERIFGFPA